jgi:flavin-binding protein dodecin
MKGHCMPSQELADSLKPFYRKERKMAESVYKVIELVGTSTESWEKAAAAAVETASKSLQDLRIAEVVELDMQLEGGKVALYRAKVKLSFKYHQEE